MGSVSTIVQLCESVLSVIIAGFMTFASKILIVSYSSCTPGTTCDLKELLPPGTVISRKSFLQEL